MSGRIQQRQHQSTRTLRSGHNSNSDNAWWQQQRQRHSSAGTTNNRQRHSRACHCRLGVLIMTAAAMVGWLLLAVQTSFGRGSFHQLQQQQQPFSATYDYSTVLQTTPQARIVPPPPHLPHWMAAYVDLHRNRRGRRRRRRDIMADGSGADKDDDDDDDGGPGYYLVYKCPGPNAGCGGLGNRLCGMVMSLYVALMTNRTIVIDVREGDDDNDDDNSWWSLPSEDGSSSHHDAGHDHSSSSHARRRADLTAFLQPAHLEWNVSNDDDDDELLLLPSFGQPQLTRQTEERPFEVISTVDNPQHDYLLEPCTTLLMAAGSSPRIVEIRNNVMPMEKDLRQSKCWNDYWNSVYHPDSQHSTTTTTDRRHHYHGQTLFSIGFWTLFRFTPLVQSRAQELKQRAGMRAIHDSRQHQQQQHSSYYYIGLHIRTGRGATWQDPVRHGSKDDLSRFYQCALKLQHGIMKKKRYNQLPATSSTNSSTNIDMYIASDNNDAKREIQSWNKDGTVKIVDDLQVFHVDRTNVASVDNVYEAYLNVWGELKVLIDATCLVMSHSTFSYIASELNNMAHAAQQTPCAILFDECSDANVTRVLNRLDKIPI